MRYRILGALVGLLAMLVVSMNVGCDKATTDEVIKILTSSLTKDNIVEGLKAALQVSADTSAIQAHKENGYYGNPLIKILAPEPVRQMQECLSSGSSDPVSNAAMQVASPALNSVVENMLKSVNHAAEEAAGEAFPIFREAVTGMTIQDGLKVLQGGPHSATDFLREKTEVKLTEAFAPIVQKWVDAGNVTQYWNKVMTTYNSYAPLAKPVAKTLGYELADHVEEDLYKYATAQALNGLFKLSQQEEEKIRRDPKGYVTSKWENFKDVISKVFGSPEAQEALK